MKLSSLLNIFLEKIGFIKHKPCPEQKMIVRLSQETCFHTVWNPESKLNGWRETCRDCGLQAAGSCQ